MAAGQVLLDFSMRVIGSPQNESVKALRKLREQKNFFWWEGERFFAEICREKPHVSHLLVTEDRYIKFKDRIGGISTGEILVVSEKLFESIARTDAPQGIGGIIERPFHALSELSPDTGPAFYLCGIQDPGNAGAVLRIADAFGFSGVIYERRGASPFGDKAVRASAGSVLRVVTAEGEAASLNKLAKRGFTVIMLSPPSAESRSIDEISPDTMNKAVFVLGQEGSGIDITCEGAVKAHIPICRQVESLNVAVSAGIVAYLATGGRRR